MPYLSMTSPQLCGAGDQTGSIHFPEHLYWRYTGAQISRWSANLHWGTAALEHENGLKVYLDMLRDHGLIKSYWSSI